MHSDPQQSKTLTILLHMEPEDLSHLGSIFGLTEHYNTHGKMACGILISLYKNFGLSPQTSKRVEFHFK